jgi:type II secretory pathway pseudopilin PulG
MHKKQLFGFSLLEMVLACVIFSTCILLMTGVWATHNDAVGRTRMQMIGSHVAEQVLEEAIALGYKNLPDPPHTLSGDVSVDTIVRSKTQSAAYHWTRTIQPAGTLGQLKSIQVLVEWQDGPNRKRKVNLESIVFDGT